MDCQKILHCLLFRQGLGISQKQSQLAKRLRLRTCVKRTVCVTVSFLVSTHASRLNRINKKHAWRLKRRNLTPRWAFCEFQLPTMKILYYWWKTVKYLSKFSRLLNKSEIEDLIIFWTVKNGQNLNSEPNRSRNRIESTGDTTSGTWRRLYIVAEADCRRTEKRE